MTDKILSIKKEKEKYCKLNPLGLPTLSTDELKLFSDYLSTLDKKSDEFLGTIFYLVDNFLFSDELKSLIKTYKDNIKERYYHRYAH